MSDSPQIRILLVEDTEEDIDLLKLKLSKLKLSYELVSVPTGGEAVAYLEKNYSGNTAADLPLVILLDLRLPDKDGIQILQEIRQNAYWTEIPVIILTSSDKQQDLVTAYKSGATLFMRKPFEGNLFLEVFNRLRITGRIKS